MRVEFWNAQEAHFHRRVHQMRRRDTANDYDGAEELAGIALVE
jgi:hypothetical protein